MTWYTEVTANLAAIPDFITHYEAELQAAKREVQIWGNVEKVTATGIELAGQANDVIVRGLDIGGNITRVYSRIAQDSAPGSYGQSVVGNPIPYTPPLRFTTVATYRPDQQLAYTVAGRFQLHHSSAPCTWLCSKRSKQQGVYRGHLTAYQYHSNSQEGLAK